MWEGEVLKALLLRHRSDILSVTELQSRSLYGRHVSTSFLNPVFGAMMKQAYRQTLKSLAAECLVSVRLGLLNFLTPVCVD